MSRLTSFGEQMNFHNYGNGGQKNIEGTYKDGEFVGLFIFWYENGQKRSEGTYKDGEQISIKQWNEDGSVKN